MTPLEIKMLLHFHCSPEPFRPWGDVHSEFLEGFQRAGLVVMPTNVDRPQLTGKGEAYVRFLCAMPMPQETYTLPGNWHQE